MEKRTQSLQNELKSEKISSAKLLQYKMGAKPRLDIFEQQASRMNVIDNLNIDKVIHKMGDNQRTLDQLKSQTSDRQEYMA